MKTLKTVFYNCRCLPYNFLMKGKIIWPLAIFAYAASAQVSYVPKALTLYKGGHEFGTSLEFFQTSKVADSDGKTYDLLNNERFQMIDLDFSGRYGFTNNLELSGGMKVRSNSSNQYYAPENNEYSFSTTGLHSIYGGAKYSFPNQGGLLLALEGEYQHRLYGNSETNIDDPPSSLELGDEGPSASFGFSGSYMSSNRNFLSGKLLYRNPGSNLSSEIYTEVEAAMAWNYVALVAGVGMVNSLGQDAYEGDPENKPQFGRGPGNQFNSVNRSWTAPYGGLNIALGDEWRVESKIYSKVSGSSTDLGTGVIISLVKRVSDAKSFQKKDAAFKEYTVEASVVKLSKSGNVVVIDAGADDGLSLRSKIDFYYFDYRGGNELIAAGMVVKLGATKSLVKISKSYSKKEVKEGTLARGGLIRTDLP